MSNEYKFIISDEKEEDRLDKVLAILIPSASRSYIQKLIKQGEVKINENIILKPSCILKIDDELVVNVPELTIPEIQPENIPLNIVYEDKDLMIVNKPKNMVVHPAIGHYTGTLVNAIMYHCKDLSGINGVLRPGIVHRIDKDTTGLLIICKNDLCHNNIAEQLKVHNIERTYHAIVHGNIKEDSGKIVGSIGRHPTERKKMAINEINGKPAVTNYKVLKRFGNYTYIECKLETGRTHQIRVHMSSQGHPILGDELYGSVSNKFKTFGQTLHAKTIGFVHPTTKEWICFDSELPEYFQKILNTLENNM